MTSSHEDKRGPYWSVEEPTHLNLSAVFWAKVSFPFFLLVLIPIVVSIYALKFDEVPLLPDMEFAVGTVSFAGGGKRGSDTVITTADGEKVIFSCATYGSGYRYCVHPKHKGKVAEIKWFWIKTAPWSKHRLPGQIVIDGEILISRVQMVKKIRGNRWAMPVMALIPLFGFFIIFGLMINAELNKREI